MIGEEPGYPRFRGKNRYDSFIYPQFGSPLRSGKLHLSKIGDIKIKMHREIDGSIKTCTIRRMPTGKWFACFSVETNTALPPRRDGPAVGIDVGLQSFATRSTGEKIDNPRFFRSDEEGLARVQRKHPKAQKGSPERKNALKVVQRVHARIADHRTDFINQISCDLVDRFSILAFEDLDIKNMVLNHNLAKSISDVAWGMLVTAAQDRTAYAGSEVVLVYPRNTSQVCSGCGIIVQIELSDRVHSVPGCGLSILSMDRDINAALNILKLGRQFLRQIDGIPGL